jgi:hypothetical protein
MLRTNYTANQSHNKRHNTYLARIDCKQTNNTKNKETNKLPVAQLV